MSVYFIHIFKELLCISIFGGIFSKDLKLRNILISFFLGYIYAFIAFYIAKEHLKLEQIYCIGNILIIICFIFSVLFLIKAKSLNIIKYILFMIFSFGYFIRYFYLSNGFPIFSTNFVDNQVIISSTLIVLSILFTIALFFIIAFIRQYNQKLILVFNTAFIFMCINIAFSRILLYMDRYGYTDEILSDFADDVKTNIGSNIITYIAKFELFFDNYFIYILMFMLMILGINALRKKIANPIKKHTLDIEYRKIIHHNDVLSKTIASMVGILAFSLCVNLYYVNIESKPIELSEAKTPVEEDGYFVFDIAEFRDNDLHRYAYVTPSGKRVRFFIINKFEDKDSPSVVFDACSICGDMGYVLKNNEIICVACGVRVFRPSVGKRNGCNPIPIENFSVKDEKIYVPISEVVAGETFFSEKVPVEVVDPVDGSKLYNDIAAEEYSYYGVMYYFKSKENYEKFIKEPEKYIKKEQKGRFIISDNNKGVSDAW